MLILGLATVSAAAAVGLLVSAPGEDGPPWVEEVGAEQYKQLSRLAGRASARQVSDVLALLDPGEQLAAFVELDAGEARIKADHSATPVVVPLARESVIPTRPSTLAGLRVLLDPGHFGGAWSEVESRHIAGNAEPVREGDLTWAVGRLLAEKLEAAGAAVTLSRGPPPARPFPHDLHPEFELEREAGMVLEERLRQAPYATYHRLYPAIYGALMLERSRQQIAGELGLFHLYNRFDLRRRAALGADHDLTLSIHFNTTGPLRRNWVMAFVPGNLLAGEAETSSQRFWFLRQALAGQWPEMVALARSINAAMKVNLELPSLDPTRLHGAKHPAKVIVDREHGVFARNLAMLRRTPGIVVLVEGPCVDEETEYQRLQDRSVVVDGQRYPRRVREYADAVFAGLEVWVAQE